MGFFYLPFNLLAGRGARRENFHGERRELEHGGGEGEGVAAVSAKPAREVVGAAGDFGVEADAGDAAEVARGDG